MCEVPDFVQALSKKRSLKFKDPARSALAMSLNDLPQSQIKQVITPAIVKRDQAACQQILSKIQADEIADEYRVELLQKKQALTRARLLRQHEKIIDLERASGIDKEYAQISYVS